MSGIHVVKAFRTFEHRHLSFSKWRDDDRDRRAPDQSHLEDSLRGIEVQTVFVDPSRHSMRYEQLLMKHLEDVAKSRGVSQIALQSSLTSKDFNQNLGYHTHREPYGAVGGQMILIMKRL